MKLFRGVNIDMWDKIKNDGFILPRETSFEITFRLDGTIKHDGSATHGPSWKNAVLGHQIDSNIFKTSGISTTPNYERAKFYALNNGRYSNGVIMELDLDTIDLDEYEIITVSDNVKEPTIVEDEEIIIRRFDNQPIALNLFNIHFCSSGKPASGDF